MKPITKQTITVPAAAGGQSSSLNVSVAGDYFYCESASANFQIQFDAGGVVSVSPPQKIPGTFKRLTFFNSNTVQLTVAFYVSDTPVDSGAIAGAQISNSLGACVPAAIMQAVITKPGSGGDGLQLANPGTYARTIILIARQTMTPSDAGGTDNTSNVQIGFSGTPKQQPIEMVPGAVWNFDAPQGAKLDLGQFYLNVLTGGDGIVVIYW